MRDAQRRLERLESQHSDHSARRVVVAPIAGDGTSLPAAGFTCGEIVTRRQPGETEAACWDRHSAALDDRHGPAVTTISAPYNFKHWQRSNRNHAPGGQTT